MIEQIIFLCIVWGIPTIFLFLSIKSIVEIVKAKKKKITVGKSLIIKSILFPVIFILILIFYIWIRYLFTVAIVANM